MSATQAVGTVNDEATRKWLSEFEQKPGSNVTPENVCNSHRCRCDPCKVEDISFVAAVEESCKYRWLPSRYARTASGRRSSSVSCRRRPRS